PAARQENHGAAPTSCSGSKRRSLNSLKNCLDRWVHFMVYGLTMPLHGARGELGALSLSVEAENRAEANRFMESVLPTLWMLKDYALQSGAGLAFEHPVSKPVVLTSREKEVLQWCAIGKTSWEISVICNCSEANVNFHMGNIRRKFGVTSRRVAAIMAVNLGLITL
ncbi:helix-turn-helix transcriptional regulator, partial [Pseudomonas aeruginosa]|uniref:helix-turn-helix transcriptional regulator n=1 Tax=Pseudomonas aeruginosa TaxID=287 RepID=UPI00313701DB